MSELERRKAAQAHKRGISRCESGEQEADRWPDGRCASATNPTQQISDFERAKKGETKSRRSGRRVGFSTIAMVRCGPGVRDEALIAAHRLEGAELRLLVGRGSRRREKRTKRETELKSKKKMPMRIESKAATLRHIRDETRREGGKQTAYTGSRAARKWEGRAKENARSGRVRNSVSDRSSINRRIPDLRWVWCGLAVSLSPALFPFLVFPLAAIRVSICLCLLRRTHIHACGHRAG